eukprot:30623_1
MAVPYLYNSKLYLNAYRFKQMVYQKYFMKYPPAETVALYNKFMNKSRNHLEIGTASVDWPIKAEIEDRLTVKVTLLDLEELPLQYAKTQMVANGFDPSLIKTIQCDVTNIPHDAIEPQTFDTIGISNVLHCIPGPMSEKLPKIVEALSPYMNQHTQFFGCCYSNMPFDRYNSPQELFMRWLQNRNMLFNQNDTPESIKEVLDQYFDASRVIKKDIWICVTMFEATHFKSKPSQNAIVSSEADTEIVSTSSDNTEYDDEIKSDTTYKRLVAVPALICLLFCLFNYMAT